MKIKKLFSRIVAVMLAVTESTRSAFLNEAYKVKVGDYLTAASTMNLSGNVIAQANSAGRRIA